MLSFSGDSENARGLLNQDKWNYKADTKKLIHYKSQISDMKNITPTDKLKFETSHF